MVGRKLADRLVRDKALNGKAIDKLTLIDVVAPAAPAGLAGKTESLAADLPAPGKAEAMIAGRPDVIFHLAAVVSGEAEADFDKGYRINLDGTRALLDAIRKTGDGYRPKLVFTSSAAVMIKTPTRSVGFRRRDSGEPGWGRPTRQPSAGDLPSGEVFTRQSCRRARPRCGRARCPRSSSRL